MENKNKDEKLVELFFSRDEQAIAQTRRVYGKYLFTVIRSVLENESDCEECENDVLLALWERIPPEKPRCFKAYMTGLARAIAINRYHAKARKKRAGSEYAVSLEELYECFGSPDGTEEEVENNLLRDAIDRFVSSLDRKRRYVFVSRFCLSVPIAQIAKELGVSESTVFNDLRFIKKQLKEQLKKEGF